jgi:N-acetylmuramoyl-L-alanine amidase
MESCAAALDRLCDPEAEVSAHYLIDYDGAVLALVPEEQRAWHAGAGRWAGRGDVNSRSIGIELANTGNEPFGEPQMAALEVLLQGVMARWGIPPAGVIGHSDMAPDRKFDPGPRFDWRRLARGGLSVWPDPVSEAGQTSEVDPAAFHAALAAFGYQTPPDVPPDALLLAFRARFRPAASGDLTLADLAAAQALARAFPCSALLAPVDAARPSA